MVNMLVGTILPHGASAKPVIRQGHNAVPPVLLQTALVVLLKCLPNVKPFLLSEPNSVCLHFEYILLMSACPKPSSSIHIAESPHSDTINPI